jgi:aminoglycoside phosphotransferase (APT) family kinase protein
MSQPWAAERVVTADLAGALIETQFPALAPVRVETFGAGWDNTAYLVNGGYVFRFPRREFVVPFLASETRLLPVLAPLLPLPVPRPIFVGQPTKEFPWLFAGYTLLPGRTACGAALNETERVTIAEELGSFLAVLHSAPVGDAARNHGAGPDPINRLNPTLAIPKARALLNALAGRGLIDNAKQLSAIIDASAPGYVPRTDTLVHGDLYARHLLVDGQNRLAGVIDWGDVHLGDPALDLTIALTYLPPAARAMFVRAYGPVTEETWRVARFRGLRHTLHVLDYAHSVADADLMRESRLALRHMALA